MTLEETVHQRLASWQPQGEGRHTLSVLDENSGWRARMTTERQENLSCSLWELSLERSLGATLRHDGLRSWSQNVAARVTGLVEPLSLVELDVERAEALLRSTQPTHRSDESFYYEILLKGDYSALVRRYRAAAPGDRREQIPFPLTHETLSRLASDIVSALP
jgi:hypothetical protein